MGRSAARDPIALVEACYEAKANDNDWLENVARLAEPLLKAEGLLAYHIEVNETNVVIGPPVAVGPAAEQGDAIGRIRVMADLLERCRSGKASLLERAQGRVYEKVIRKGIAQPADHFLLSEMETYGPRWMYTLGVPRARELIHLVNNHIDDQGTTLLVGPRLKANALHPGERATYQMVSAHIKAGLRLRRRLGARVANVDAPADGAILDASMRVVHANGEARENASRELLATRAKDVDRARTQAGGRDVDALEVWHGLIDGRWSLVERYDADGKRFLVAHRNEENVKDPRGLSSLEARVMALAARGYGDKLIAYHLGVGSGTVASCLSRALRKLGLSTRTELVRMLSADARSTSGKGRGS